MGSGTTNDRHGQRWDRGIWRASEVRIDTIVWIQVLRQTASIGVDCGPMDMNNNASGQ